MALRSCWVWCAPRYGCGAHVVIDAHDLPAMARFWAQVLGWRILSEHEQEIVIGADATAPVGICFMPVRDIKTTKNRLHLDLSPDPGEQEAEIERILALGARRVDIGQTGVPIGWWAQRLGTSGCWVAGRKTRKEAPPSGRSWTQARPPWRLANWATRARPIPEPGAWSAILRPWWKG